MTTSRKSSGEWRMAACSHASARRRNWRLPLSWERGPIATSVRLAVERQHLAIQVFDVDPIEVPSCSISSYASSVTGSGIVRAMGRLATPAANAICAAIGKGSC